MSKRKAEALSTLSAANDIKRLRSDTAEKPSDSAKHTLLIDSDESSSSGSEDDSESGGVTLKETEFKINQDFANRFEHNKKREELQRLEEKYQKEPKPSNGKYGDKYDEDEDDSSDEDEDDEGFLATEALDAEISATLRAIQSKDPRVYDEKVTFYAPVEGENDEGKSDTKKEKPMYLRDYHRENLLNGITGAEEIEESAPQTFAEEQDELKKTIVKEMHAKTADGNSEADNDSDDGGFIVPKAKGKARASEDGVHPSRKQKVQVDVSSADKDPDTFLSNFMAARAWVPTEQSRFQPFESDDEEEDERAEAFEAAYNMRFEDPKGSNETLKSYARDVVAARSVRREEPNNRKKARDAQREKKEAQREEREEERGRLRRLKIEELEAKLARIKKAAGMRGRTLREEEWRGFLDEGWDDARWEAEMSKRFGEEYYAEQEGGSGSDDEDAAGKKKRKVKKPKWDDDIDISDLVPDFHAAEQEKPEFTLTDSEADELDAGEEEEEEGEEQEAKTTKAKSSKDRRQEVGEKRKASRLQRKMIEDMVDSQLDVDTALLLPSSSSSSAAAAAAAGGRATGAAATPAAFRYRETSPTSFGLTARDILLAPSDASLNEFAGLKKMATFRDAEKKRRDKRRLGKKARLREWRRETFGDENGPGIVVGGGAAAADAQADAGTSNAAGETKKKKKKRSRKSKVQAVAA